jgi:DNA (cytosine-5)-methyltransferase 3A
LVSAQNRKRLYWTNIPFKYPLDKEIMMKDILQDPSEISPEHYHSMKAVEYMEKGNDKWGQAGSRRADGYEQTPETQKSFTLTANMHKGVPYNYFKDTRNGLIRAGDADLKGHDYVRRVYHPDGKAPTLCASSGGNLEPKTLASETTWRKLTPIECERLQTVPDNYTAHVSNTQRYKMLGNGFTVDVISEILRGILPPAYTK